MMISLPAILVLLIACIGLADYLVMLDLLSKIENVEPIAGESAVATQYAAAVRQAATSAMQQMLVFMLVFVGLAVAVGVWLVVTILSPLRKMVHAAETTALGGPPPKSLGGEVGYEFHQLEQSFNSMVNFVNSMVEQREAYLTETVQAASMIVDAEGRVTSISALGTEMLGAERDELVGERIEDVRQAHPEIAPGFLAFCHDSVDALVLARSISEQDASTVAAIVPGKAVEVKTGGSAKAGAVSVVCSLLRDADNLPHAILFHFRDVAELEHLSQIFSQTDHLAALGAFTFGLSHELRNPLGSLKGSTQLLQEKISGRADCAPYLERIVREVDRLDDLVRELYDYSRSPAEPEAAHDFNQVVAKAVREAIAGLSPDLTEAKTVREEYADQLPEALLGEARVARAIHNIVINAFEHTPAGGEITVRTLHGENGEEARVILEVTNTGSSITPENQTKIFEPFFSTRTGGTGLGLAIAYQIVMQNHGKLSVASDAGTTTFRLAFYETESVDGSA
jgi:nitrogen-specific signal transduction histidine kinase/HAMP domain-containing protein